MRALWRTLAMACALASCTQAAGKVVKVDGGLVRGKEWNGSMLFRGIPFAAPPVEKLRWKPPQPVAPWNGVRDSLDQPPSCAQNDQGWNHSDYLIGREDCLTLDVRTPSLKGRLPVLVWIHGGSNRVGGPNDIVLSDVGKHVVIVGIRYRLGIFGFLSHRKLSAEQGGSSGNYGLMDQLAALQWVKRNIAPFGGDPNNVTIAGESAGSQDVSLMLAVPATRGLFQKAIMESGTPGFGMPFRSLGDAERIGEQADALLGTKGDLAALRSAPVPALLAADLKLHDEAIESDSMVFLRITIDGKLLRDSPRRLLESAPARPAILGSNRVEFGPGPAEFDGFVDKAFGKDASAARSYYKRAATPADARLGTIEDQVGTDVTFRCPAERMAGIMATKGARVWLYEFDAAPKGGKTSHAAEIPYAFGDATFAHGQQLKPYWLNFIRSGNPNGRGLPQWPRFTVRQRQHVLFSDAGVTAQGSLRPELCSLLEHI